MILQTNNGLKLDIDYTGGFIASLCLDNRELVNAREPVFRLRLRKKDGDILHFSAFDAQFVKQTESGAVYGGFEACPGLSVSLFCECDGDDILWRAAVTPPCDLCPEWVDIPLVNLPPLEDNGGEAGTKILLPYNEGVLVSDAELRQNTDFGHCDPEYPSRGSYCLFPNMISSQMMAYICGDIGLYMGAHDPKRGVKGVDFCPENKGVTPFFRIYTGSPFGCEYKTDFPVVWSITRGNWYGAAEKYRNWFERKLPCGMKRVNEESLPEWYGDSPLVVAYPVRGRHDMDDMEPNALFPYVNALTVLDRIKNESNSRILALLMHWEGTAPWAPPYVWPPYGSEEALQEFKDALHKKGDLLGVYCSGFGYTLQSNLIREYNCEKEYSDKGLEGAMCQSPYGKVEISRICTGQRSGYDICPASDKGRELLLDAYSPLFESGVDYAQILDQNHGGGQYFCYARDHGHPPVPGPWMTENMQKTLKAWQNSSKGMLFGCESAASEPFIGNLRFSDNRFELNYSFGEPVPLYAYIYHEYVRNFMGNQVSCQIAPNASLGYRIAYSFSAGDAMTLVISPEGDIMPYWGVRETEFLPDREEIMTLVKNLTLFYRERAKPWLFCGRMIKCPDAECESVTFARCFSDKPVTLPGVHCTAWEDKEGVRCVIAVNPMNRASVIRIEQKEYTLPPLDAVMIPLA